MPFDHNDHYHRLLLRQVPHGCRTALDVGCGTGTFARRLAQRGIETEAGRATVRLADGSVEDFDLVIGADGYRSVVRQAMFPELTPAYAGYLGWRGTSEAPADLPVGADEEARVVVIPGGHCMMYLIPDGKDRKEGHRMNWVLCTRPPADSGLDAELRCPTSLPPGKVAAELTAYLRDLVAGHFPPYWADCVLRSPEERTFIQPVYL